MFSTIRLVDNKRQKTMTTWVRILRVSNYQQQTAHFHSILLQLGYGSSQYA